MQGGGESLKHSEMIYVLEQLECIKSKSLELYLHSLRVADLSFCLGDVLKEKPSSCFNLWIAGALHDVGKLFVNKDILDKPGKLNDFEFKIVQCHVLMGYNLLVEDNELNGLSLDAIAKHHERDTGKGYPFGLTVTPKYSKVLAISDVYDALVSARPYKMGIDSRETLRMIRQQGEFEEELVDALEKATSMAGYGVCDRIDAEWW